MGIRVVANLDAATLETGRVQSVNDLRPRGFKPLVSGDSTVLDLFLTGASGPLNIQDYSVVRLGIGGINARPTGGTYTFDALASPLAYNHDAAALQTAVTAEVAACTVEALGPFVFKVTFDANGAQTLPTVDMTNLAPPSSVSVKRLVEGDGSTQEVWLWRIFRNPIVLTEDWDNLGDDGLRGSLNMGTEGVYRLLAEAGNGVAESTIELELTDTDGDITTVFQIPVEIRGEVIGDGVPAIASFGSYVTTGDLDSRFATANVLWVSKSGNDSTGARGRFDLPYLTVGAAETAAQSGDVIRVLQGSYTSETIRGKDGVFYDFMEGSIGPQIEVSTAITIKGRGLCERLYCDNAGAVIDMPKMDTVTDSIVVSGKIVCRNVGGQAEAFDEEQNGSPCILECNNASFFYSGLLGFLTIRNANQSYDGALLPIAIESSGSITIENSRHEFTGENGNSFVVDLRANWSGKLIAKNCTFVATNAGTDGATKGINYGTGVTGQVQLINCSIITAQNGTGTAKSIDAPSAQSVIIQGTLNQTHAEDSDITFVGGTAITNTNFDG
jgi:hypothetical protein